MQKHLIILSLLIFAISSCQSPSKPTLKSSAKHLLDTSIVNNPKIEAKIAPLRDSVESIMKEVIGESAAKLYPEKPETPLSNFVADLILDAAEKEIEKNQMEELPVITVVNVRGLRTSLPKGKITVENIFSLMPFENHLVILKLSGQNVRKLFYHMGDSGGDGLAGASFTFTSGKITDARINGQELNSDNFYYVATSDYLASGGDHYTIFQEAEDKYESPQKIRGLIIKHIRELTNNQKLIDPATNIRIRFK